MSNKVRALIFLLINIIYTTCFSQQWIRTFNGSGNDNDESYAITVDNDGNVYVAGYATTAGGGADMCIIKYNSAGGLEWVRSYNGPGNSDDKAYAITVDNTEEHNIYITGYSTGVGSGRDFTTIKYNTEGFLQWVSRYNEAGNNNDEAYAITVDGLGNVYVTGYITRIVKDYYTIKYNASGVYVWGQVYNGPGNAEDKATAIVLDNAGDLIVTGYSKSVGNDFDYATIKYNSNGVEQWVGRYNGQGNNEDKAYAITVDSIGKIYVTGYSTGIGSSLDYRTIKYDSNGDTIWTARYNGPGNNQDIAYSIALTSGNEVLVTGSSRSGTNSGSEDYATVKYNSSGVQQWVSRYNGTGNSIDVSRAVFVPLSNKAAFVTGFSRNDTLAGKEDILSIKYDLNNGTQLQSARYNGPENRSDAAYALVMDTSDNIYLTGYSEGNSSGYDFITMKYLDGELIKVITLSSNVPRDFRLYQNFPNPFNPNTTIRFDIVKSSLVNLTVYDLLGRETAKLVNEYLPTGSYEVIFNIPRLSSGIYFYEIVTDEFRDMKKMILIK